VTAPDPAWSAYYRCMGTLKPPTILSVEDHYSLTNVVNGRLQDLHNNGVSITPDGVTQFKIEGLFETIIEMCHALWGISREDASRLIDTHFLESMDKWVLTKGEEARQEGLRQKITSGVGNLSDSEIKAFTHGR